MLGSDMMRNKICHITSVHKRYDGRIFKKQCTTLSSQGYDVNLIVNDFLPDEIKNGIKIVSTNYHPKSRILRFVSSGRKLLEKALEIDADIYHLHDPDLLLIGNKLKKIGKKVIFDSHEDYPSDIASKEWIPKILRKPIAKGYEIFEKKSLKKYDAIITVSPHIVERLEKINSNSYLITNYPMLKSDANMNSLNKEFVNNTICFAGAIHKDWGHHIIIDAIEMINNTRYILVGPSSETYLSKLKVKKSWCKVDYRGVVTPAEVQQIYKESNIGIAVHYSDSLAGKGTLGNTKLFEFMEAGLPIICSNYPLWDEIVMKYKCGISVNPRNVNEIKEAIEYIIEHPSEAKHMALNGMEAVRNEYNWSTQKPILLDIYKFLSDN
jgi:glycosyltransferase involved in cell wall biosynthesis